MSTRTKSTYQDPRYLQLWLTFEWPQPTGRVPVACAGCGWNGRRQKCTAGRRPCPSCAGRVARSARPVQIRSGRDRSNVVTLTGRAPATRRRSGAGRRVSGQAGRVTTGG